MWLCGRGLMMNDDGDEVCMMKVMVNDVNETPVQSVRTNQE